MRTVLANAEVVWTGDRTAPCPRPAHVSVVDGVIEHVQAAPIVATPDAPIDRRIDLRGCLLIPGLINLHHHFFQSVTRAWPGLHTAGSPVWLTGLYTVWARMTDDDCTVAARNAMAELLLSGATTSVDHAFLLGTASDARLAAEAAAAHTLGLRLHLVRSGLPTIGGRVEAGVRAVLGDAGFASLVDEPDALLAACERDVANWHDPGEGAMLRIDLGPSNVPYEAPTLLEGLADLARRAGCGLHMHFHPRVTERALCARLHGLQPVELLERSEWLTPRTSLVHCTELDDNDIDAFAAHGVGVVHCPRTVVRLGYAMPRIARLRARGVTIGVGADGAASNDAGNFLGDLRLAGLLHRVGASDGDPAREWLAPDDVLHMATTDAARLLGRADIGRIAPGLRADLAAFDLQGIDLAGGVEDPIGGFLLAGSAPRAQLTMVDGRVVVRDGALVDADEAAIAAATRDASRRLRRRTAS